MRKYTCSVTEAAQLLGCSRSAAYCAVKSGELPVETIGRRRLVIVAKLESKLGLAPGTLIDQVNAKKTEDDDTNYDDLSS